MIKLITDFHKLWERLIELSNKAIPDVSKKATLCKFVYIYNFLIGRHEHYNKFLVTEPSPFTCK